MIGGAEPSALIIAWAPHNENQRSAAMAQGLDIPCYFIHVFTFQRPLVAPFKYPIQALISWYVLWRNRPQVVIVQNPPVFAVLCVALYCWLGGARFIIDSHSGALVERKWVWSRPIQRWLGRGALATLLHTPTLLPYLTNAGHIFVTGDPPLALRQEASSALQQATPCVVVIGSFAHDEPVDAVLAAAALLPEVHFVLTGNPSHATKPKLLQELSTNIKLAGWLNVNDYIALLRSANVILTLTTRDLTVLQGAYEAVYVGKPLVTSNWPALRSCFNRGTIFVNNNASSIAKGILEALQNEQALHTEMLQLCEDKHHEWNETLDTLRNLLMRPPKATVSGLAYLE